LVCELLLDVELTPLDELEDEVLSTDDDDELEVLSSDEEELEVLSTDELDEVLDDVLSSLDELEEEVLGCDDEEELDDDVTSSAHAVVSITETDTGSSGSLGLNVMTMDVPSSPTGISTEPSSLGVTVIGVPSLPSSSTTVTVTDSTLSVSVIVTSSMNASSSSTVIVTVGVSSPSSEVHGSSVSLVRPGVPSGLLLVSVG